MKVRATHPFRPTKMFQSFFDVTPIELGQLGPEPAVAVLREMIWAEVNNLGIPISATDIPFPITTSDGGVDAVVDGIPTCPGNGLIFAPRPATKSRPAASLSTRQVRHKSKVFSSRHRRSKRASTPRQRLQVKRIRPSKSVPAFENVWIVAGHL